MIFRVSGFWCALVQGLRQKKQLIPHPNSELSTSRLAEEPRIPADRHVFVCETSLKGLGTIWLDLWAVEGSCALWGSSSSLGLTGNESIGLLSSGFFPTP